MVAQSLVNPGEHVTVRLINLTRSPQTVDRNTIVGFAAAVTSILETGDKVCVPKSEDRYIPEHLEELYL